MGRYINKSDVEDVFGTTNVAKWSQLDGLREADEARIDRSIEWAEDRIESKMRRSVYEVPFQPKSGAIDAVLINWMAVYAGHWLYMHRQIRANDENDRTMKLKQMTDDEINEVLARQSELDLAFKDSSAPTAPTHVFD